MSKMNPKPLSPLMGLLLLGWIVFGATPAVYRMFLGVQFLPSTDWVESISIVAIVFGLFSAVLITWIVFKGLAINARKTRKFNRYLAIFAAPLFGFFLGNTAITISAPFAMVLANSEKNFELSFTVSRFQQSIDRKCPNPLELIGLPYFFDEICGVNEDFGNSLQSGDRVIVKGKGNHMGVFAQTVQTTG